MTSLRAAWALVACPFACHPVAFGIVIAAGPAAARPVGPAQLLCAAFSRVGLVILRAAPQNAVSWPRWGTVVGETMQPARAVVWPKGGS